MPRRQSACITLAAGAMTFAAVAQAQQSPARSLDPAGPAYGAQTALPYGAGLPTPYAYGAGRPSGLPRTYNTPTAVPEPDFASGARPPSTPPEGSPTSTGTLVPAPAGAGGAYPSPSGGQPLDLSTRQGIETAVSPLPSAGGPTKEPGTVFHAPPAYAVGDPYARTGGDVLHNGRADTTRLIAPYTTDGLGRYYNSYGDYRGRVDNQGVVRDQYGSKRGSLSR